MSLTQQAHRPVRRINRSASAGLIALALLASVGCGCSAPTAPTTQSPPAEVLSTSTAHAPGEPPQLPPPAGGAADGAVPDATTVFSGLPAVANLNPALLRQLRRAASAAAVDGLEFEVNSGWRSQAYQKRLFDDAVATYGSTEEAARWVARPGISVHEGGDAVDLGPSSATSWLARYGSDFGLCQTYLNEPWHYELRPVAQDSGCPDPYADPTHDPRLQP